jgi:hypothetical protein
MSAEKRAKLKAKRIKKRQSEAISRKELSSKEINGKSPKAAKSPARILKPKDIEDMILEDTSESEVLVPRPKIRSPRPDDITDGDLRSTPRKRRTTSSPEVVVVTAEKVSPEIDCRFNQANVTLLFIAT